MRPAMPQRRLHSPLRALILKTAASTHGVGELEEALKRGEPTYLTSASKIGSTIRINWKKSEPSKYAIYFNCQTSLVETFKTLFPREFEFEGNRAIVCSESGAMPTEALAFCFRAALTHHRIRKNAGLQ